MKKLMLLILTLPLFITGCWDKVEIEDRGFVVSIGINKYEKDDKAAEFKDDVEANRYTVLMSLPNVSALLDKADEEKSKSVKISASETVSAAMKLADSYSSQKLYFGQAKVLVLGEELLKDEGLFREAVDAMERNRELSRKLIVLSTKDEMMEVINASAPGEPLIGIFVSSFYKNNSSTVAMAFRQDLGSIIRELRFSGDVVIPRIALEGEEKKQEIKLGGAAVMKSFALKGWLNDKQTRGYLWAKADGKGAQIIVPFEGTYASFRVNQNKSDIHFLEENGHVICTIDIKIKGTVEEFLFSSGEISKDEKLSELKAAYEEVITDEINETFKSFQEEFEVDGFGLCRELRKKNYDIYLDYGTNLDELFENMELRTNVSVDITSTGVIK